MSGSEHAPWAPGYDTSALLHQGRRARIIRATRSTSGADVVLKVLPEALGRAELNQLRDLAGVPGVVPLLDAGTTADGAVFVVLPFYADGSFGDMLVRKGPAPILEAAAVARSAAGALGSMHGRGLLHNDVCPGNILRAGRTPVLTGFGAVQRTGEALPPPVPGTEAFLHAAPEALRGEPRSPATDVYQLASTIWTMLAGHAPFAATDGTPFDARAYAERALSEEPRPVPRPDISRKLRGVLTRALSKLPEERFQSASAFASAFEQARTAKPAATAAPAPSGATGGQAPLSGPQEPMGGAAPATGQRTPPTGPRTAPGGSGPSPAAQWFSTGPQTSQAPATPPVTGPNAPAGSGTGAQVSHSAPTGAQNPYTRGPGAWTPPSTPSSPAPSAPSGPQVPPGIPVPQPPSGPQVPAHDTAPAAQTPSGPQVPPPGPAPAPPSGPQAPAASWLTAGPPAPHPYPAAPGTGPRPPGGARRPTGPHAPPAGPRARPTGPQDPPTGPQDPPSGPQASPAGPQDPPSGPQDPQDPQHRPPAKVRREPLRRPTGLEGSRLPALDAGGTAEIMMAKMRGEEISPLRAWSRLEGWTGTAESSFLPVDATPAESDDVPEWSPVHAPDQGQARWRRHLHIAVTVCGILLATSVSGVLAATGPEEPVVTAAAEEPEPEAPAEDPADEVVAPEAPPEVAAPSQVLLSDNYGSVELAWTDNSGGTASFFVLGGPRDHPAATLARTGPGVVSAQIVTDNTAVEYCFTVVAVEGSSSPADEVCTTRAADQAEADRLEQEEEERQREEEEQEEEEADPSPSPSPDAAAD